MRNNANDPHEHRVSIKTGISGKGLEGDWVTDFEKAWKENPWTQGSKGAAEYWYNRGRVEWISVEDRLPDSGRKVLVYYKNALGNGRTVCAKHLEQYSEEACGDNDDEGVSEYCEEDDTFYNEQGWWEMIDNWDDYGFCRIYQGDITHWMPLPEPPKAKDTPKAGKE